MSFCSHHLLLARIVSGAAVTPTLGAGKAPAAPGGATGAVYDQGPMPGWATRTDKCDLCLLRRKHHPPLFCRASQILCARSPSCCLFYLPYRLPVPLAAPPSLTLSAPALGPAAPPPLAWCACAHHRCFRDLLFLVFFSVQRRLAVALLSRANMLFVADPTHPYNCTNSPNDFLPQSIPGGDSNFALWCIGCQSVFGNQVTLWIKDQSGGGTPPVQARTQSQAAERTASGGPGMRHAAQPIDALLVKPQLLLSSNEKEESHRRSRLAHRLCASRFVFGSTQVLVSNLYGLGEGSRQTYCNNKVDIRSVTSKDVGGGYKECARALLAPHAASFLPPVLSDTPIFLSSCACERLITLSVDAHSAPP